MFFMVHGSWAKVLVPEPINYASKCKTGRDDDEPLVGRGRSGVGNVHVLASLQHPLVDAVKADGVGVGLSRYLVKLGGHVLHAGDVLSNLVDVADV